MLHYHYHLYLVPQVQRNERIVLAAFSDQKPVGSVQVVLASPPNQRHRGEIAKLVVHRSARNQGIAQALMGRAEEEAVKAGKWLLMLDTVTGDAAERLYTRLGWHQVGAIPNYAYRPDGTLSGSTYFYKDLRP